MANPGPGYREHPEHKITVQPYSGQVDIDAHGVPVAASGRALELREATYPPILYLPKSDVRMAQLEPSDHSTYCPFKGHARYWHIRAGDQLIANAVWAYDEPYDEVAMIKDHVAFYRDKVDLTS